MCFSPPVMLATFLIEFGLLFYTIWRYKLTTTTRLVVAFLAALGTFQLAEYMICGGLGLGHTEWVQVGYVSITLLPALGMHLTATLAGQSVKPLIMAAYLSAAAYAVYFIAYGGMAISHECSPNYTIFDLSGNGYLYYGLYYYGWLLLTAGLAAYWARLQPKKALLLRWMVAGYAVFIVPTSIANILDPATLRAIPSIMCGFAILFALILVWRIMPLSKTPIIRHVAFTKRRAA
ncbi:MAG: rane protein of unknown function [Candidatus Saccharibacteria bacterium]|nr:rane protein of unknown function [Candidatus Saccharibacteria bacterium]